ncbi:MULTISPECIES: phosphoethanolamine transferase [Glaesserella]|uniref:Phosphoethanolamine transferase n=1 Tax=Glaesserella australis TaxID=2094024 RepID=A0A328C4I6_9PAST|nr:MULTISPECIES: phosphoethanolamine--lipid A transferase [Glaesserella]AUI66889.1 phosphoethanolamine transferase [Glaesserella sp. 15-184]RAL19940.1 phosphoethanolamine transferase [Glaesserella australis]
MFSFLPKWKLSSTTLNFIVSLYFTLALNLGFYEQVLVAQPLTWQPESYFLLTIPFVYFFALNIILNVLSIPYLHKIIIPLLILISAAISYNSLFFNIYFDVDMLNNVLQTNFAESSRTLTTSFLLWLFCLGIIPTLLYLSVKIEYKPWWKELLARLGSVMISVVVILGVAKFYYQDYASFFRNNKSLPYLITPSNFVASSIKKIRHHYRDNLPYTQLDLDAKLAKPDDYRHVTVLVVGETTRAQNWGLNGYARQTTPKLAARGDEIINFTDVNSCGTATAVSVPCMFSALTQDEFSNAKAYKQDNLLDILQCAGMDVMWLNNNSDCKGVCERVPTKNIIELNLPEFCRDGECLDNILLPEIEKALKESTNKDIVIVAHTMGSHGPTYYERYTDKEKVFTPTCDTNEINRCSNEELINTYDNGIVYLDQFLNNIISMLESHEKWESTLFYVSDHGESLGENGLYLHGAPYSIAPEYQTKVPMIMWFSKEWVKNEPFDLNCVRKNAKTKTYSHDNFFHSVIGTTDLNLSLSTYRKDLDILGQCRK